MFTRRKRVVLTTGRTEHIDLEASNGIEPLISVLQTVPLTTSVTCLFHTIKILQIPVHITNATFIITYSILVTYEIDTVFKLKYRNRIFSEIWHKYQLLSEVIDFVLV